MGKISTQNYFLGEEYTSVWYEQNQFDYIEFTSIALLPVIA